MVIFQYMNIIIFQTIRAGMVFVAVLFAFVSEVYAAPTITPASVAQITSDSAILISNVYNNFKNTTVWFEYKEDSSFSQFIAVGMGSVFGVGYFRAYLTDLKPGTTYQYRAAATEDGTTIYSPLSSFKTAGSSIIQIATSATNLNSSANTTQGQGSEAQTNSSVVQSNNNGARASSGTQGNNKVVVNTNPSVAPGDTSVTNKTISNINRGTASVIGAGNNIFPNTLIGWVMLLISIIAAVLVGRMIFESSEKRKKLV